MLQETIQTSGFTLSVNPTDHFRVESIWLAGALGEHRSLYTQEYCCWLVTINNLSIHAQQSDVEINKNPIIAIGDCLQVA